MGKLTSDRLGGLIGLLLIASAVGATEPGSAAGPSVATGSEPQPAESTALHRARAALALAFAQLPLPAAAADQPPPRATPAYARPNIPRPAPPRARTYAEAREQAMEQGQPLLVWVGQPAQSLPGTLSLAQASFPDASPECVVIGWPTGAELRRVDVPGRPSLATIQAILQGLQGQSASPVSSSPRYESRHESRHEAKR